MMDYNISRHLLGDKIRMFRKEKHLTQERLAELVDKTTEHISFIERGERSPSFELLLDLSQALGVSIAHLMSITPNKEECMDQADEHLTPMVAPVPPALISDQIENPIKPDEERKTDLIRLQEGLDNVQSLQQLAREYGIPDIFQDNGGKVLQLLILLGLKQIEGREGNDAKDEQGNEYELKTINIAPNNKGKRNTSVSTHHHLNQEILFKYRKVKAWYFGIYNYIELAEIWEVHPSILETLFSYWEKRVVEEGIELNNPKVPLKLVRTGKLVYPDKPVLDEVFKKSRPRSPKPKDIQNNSPKGRSRSKKTKNAQPRLPGLE